MVLPPCLPRGWAWAETSEQACRLCGQHLPPTFWSAQACVGCRAPLLLFMESPPCTQAVLTPGAVGVAGSVAPGGGEELQTVG